MICLLPCMVMGFPTTCLSLCVQEGCHFLVQLTFPQCDVYEKDTEKTSIEMHRIEAELQS